MAELASTVTSTIDGQALSLVVLGVLGTRGEIQPSQCRHGNANDAMPLTGLPTEMLEAICEVLVGFRGRPRYRMRHMLDFRLVSRSIRTKTETFFAKLAFGSITVCERLSSYTRLQHITSIAAFAPHVQKITLLQHDHVSSTHYEELLQQQANSEIGSQDRKQVEERILQAEVEQDSKAFHESSPLLAVALVDALLKLRNVRHFRVCILNSRGRHQTIRHKQGSTSSLLTQFFLTLISSIHYANLQPETLELPMTWHRLRQEDAVTIQALAAPSAVLQNLCNLRVLKLSLRTADLQLKSKKST